MTNLTERAVTLAEEWGELAKKYDRELLPMYFFLGHVVGEEKEEIDKVASPETKKFIKELYEKGRNLVKKELKLDMCKKCNKQFTTAEGVQFCQFCGEKI